MKNYTKILTVFILVLLVVVSGCSKKQREITDMQNRKVVLPEKTDKVVCLSPGIAELFYAFKLEDKLVARSYFCHLPEQIMALSEVGGLYRIDTAKIIEMQPDLVLSSDLLSWDSRNFLYRHNIPLVMFKDNKKFEDIYPAIELFGKVFQKEDVAKNLIVKTQQEFQQLDKTKSHIKPTAYFYIQFNGREEVTVNEKNLIGSLMTVAGLGNIAKNDSDMKFSREELFDKDPEYILVMQSKYDEFITTPAYQELSAVKNGKVISVNQDYTNPLSLSNLKFVKQINTVITQ